MSLFSSILLVFVMLMTLLLIIIKIKRRNKKHLVFSSVGDINNVHTWNSSPNKKNFDLIIYYYGDKADPEFNAEMVVKRKGLKLDNFCHYLKHHNVEKYESIWLVDDDIIMDTVSINRMFKIFSKYKLWLAQPSFDKSSLIPHSVTRNIQECVLHYTNFVEVGVPIFSTKTIEKLQGSFKNAGTGYGLDYIWPSLLEFPTDKIAVIDAVTCQHLETGYSALDEVMPRSKHLSEGIDLLVKYGLLEEGWCPTEKEPWPHPYSLQEYSRIVRQ